MSVRTAFSLNATQDNFAAGHEGFQPWDGGWTSHGSPGAYHVFTDTFPYWVNQGSAVTASWELITRFSKICKEKCNCERN